jgi:hypothetical protein
MYNFKKTAQFNYNERIKQFIQDHSGWFPEFNEDFLKSEEWRYSNFNHFPKSILIRLKNEFDNIETIDLLVIVLEALNNPYQYCNLRDNNIYLQGYGKIMSLPNFNRKLAVHFDDKLPKLRPDLYVDFLNHIDIDDETDMGIKGIQSTVLYHKLKINNKWLSEFYNYAYSESDFSDISIILSRQPELKKEFIDNMCRLNQVNKILKMLNMLKMLNNNYFYKNLTYDEFLILFNCILNHRILDRSISANFNNSLTNKTWLYQFFNEEVYNLLKNYNFCGVIFHFLNNQEFLAKFPFIQEKEVVMDTYFTSSNNANLKMVDKYFDDILAKVIETNNLKTLKQLISNYAEARIIFNTEGMFLDKENNKYLSKYREIINNLEFNFNFFIKDYFKNDGSNKKEVIEQMKPSIEEKIKKLMDVLPSVVKNDLAQGGDPAIAIELKRENLVQLDRRDIKKLTINSLKDFIRRLDQFNNQNNNELVVKIINKLGNFIYSWVSTRLLGMSETEHDVWILFLNDEFLAQPMLTSFLQKELNTELKMLQKLLEIRGSAIAEQAVLPGKEREEELMGKYYPDNRQGLLAWQSKKKLKNLPAEKAAMHPYLSQYHGTEEIKKFLGKLRFPDYKYLSEDIKEINGFTFKILDKNDPLGSVLGDLTSCCQIVGGVGEKCVVDGYNNPMSGFLAVFRGKSLIAQSWIRVGTSKTLYLDNIETIGSFNENYRKIEDGNNIKSLLFDNIFDILNQDKNSNDQKIINDQQLLREAFIEWAKYIKEKTDQNGNKLIAGVIVGGQFSDIRFPEKLDENPIDFNKEFKSNSKIYTDLSESENYRIAFNLKKMLIGDYNV